MADNGIGDEGGKAVAEALKTNRSLTQLDLGGEHGGWGGMDGREGGGDGETGYGGGDGWEEVGEGGDGGSDVGSA